MTENNSNAFKNDELVKVKILKLPTENETPAEETEEVVQD